MELRWVLQPFLVCFFTFCLSNLAGLSLGLAVFLDYLSKSKCGFEFTYLFLAVFLDPAKALLV